MIGAWRGSHLDLAVARLRALVVAVGDFAIARRLYL